MQPVAAMPSSQAGMTVTIPGDGGGTFVPDLVLVGGLVTFTLLIGALGAAIYALYRSMPPSAQTIFEAVLPPLVGLVQKQVDRTPTKIDDAAMGEITQWFKDHGLLPATLPPTAPMGTSPPLWMDEPGDVPDDDGEFRG